MNNAEIDINNTRYNEEDVEFKPLDSDSELWNRIHEVGNATSNTKLAFTVGEYESAVILYAKVTNLYLLEQNYFKDKRISINIQIETFKAIKEANLLEIKSEHGSPKASRMLYDRCLVIYSNCLRVLDLIGKKEFKKYGVNG